MRSLLLTILLLYDLFCSAQLPGLTGKLQDPSAGTYFTELTDPFAVSLNPAAGAMIKKRVFAFSAEKRFGINIFNQFSATFSMPVSSGCWNSQIDYFGFGNYTESQIALCYARSLGLRAEMGLRFQFFHVRVSDIQSLTAVYPQIGFRHTVNRDLVIGWSISNPVGVIRVQGNRSYQPLVVRVGFGYRLSAVAAIAAEIMKEEGRLPGIVVGFLYKPIQGFSMRMGIHTIARQPFINLVLQKNNWQYVTGLAWHQQLGFSPTISGIYIF